MRKLAHGSFILKGISTLLFLFFISSSFFVAPPASVSGQSASCTVTSNLSQIRPGANLTLTIRWSDGNHYPFKLVYFGSSHILHSQTAVQPNSNPYEHTFRVLDITDLDFNQIQITPGGNAADFAPCFAAVSSTERPPGNFCDFRTEPENLVNLDNAGGGLRLRIIMLTGPDAHYKAVIKNGIDNSTVEEAENRGTPTFTFTIDAPTVIGTYNLDVTGVVESTGESIDCRTREGLNFKILTIRSGVAPGADPESGNQAADTTGSLPGKVGEIVNYLVTFGIGIAGGVAFLLLVFGSFRLIFSAGNPEAVQQGREVITAAVIGLLVVVFSVVLLRLIGISILGLPI